MRYLYARVSTKEQTVDRQLAAAREYKDHYDKIFVDKKSGKDFERVSYQDLKSTVQRGDEVVIKDLDRLGRDKTGVKDELRWFHDNGVIVRVLNVPTTLMELPEGQEWVFDMVNNILIEVMGAIAQNELETIHRRTMEGIEAMPIDSEGYRISARTGRRFGRTKKPTERFNEIYEEYKQGNMTMFKACKILKISESTFKRREKELRGA